MRRLFLLLFAGAVAAAALVSAGPAGAATTVNCPPYGADNLQTAISGAGSGSTLSIRGTCVGNFNVANKTLTLQGGAPGATLDGNGGGHVINVYHASLTVRSLTITGGSDNEGGGIDLYQANATVVNSIITGNEAQYGGGIEVEQAGLEMIGTTVRGNSAEYGGGIDVFHAGATITASTIANNVADFGGGISVDEAGLDLASSAVASNRATYLGGGIYNSDGETNVTNSNVHHNTAGYDGGGIYNVGGLFSTLPAKASAGLSGIGTGALVPHPNRSDPRGSPYGPLDAEAELYLDGTTVASNRVTNSSSTDGGGGITNTAADDSASVLATGLTLRGNLARNSLGGGIAQFSNFGPATFTLAQANVSKAKNTLTDNQALYGGGIFNLSGFGDLADVTIQPGTNVSRNKAFVDGGGIFNVCGSLTIVPTVVILLNNPNNVVNICD